MKKGLLFWSIVSVWWAVDGYCVPEATSAGSTTSASIKGQAMDEANQLACPLSNTSLAPKSPEGLRTDPQQEEEKGKLAK